MAALPGSDTTVAVTIDGIPHLLGASGSVAGALLAVGIRRLRDSPRDGTPRGAFCLMGVCQECAIFIDGRIQQACLVAPRDGMAIELRGVL